MLQLLYRTFANKKTTIICFSENSEEKLVKYRYSPISNPFRSGPSFTVKGAKHVLPSPNTLKVKMTSLQLENM